MQRTADGVLIHGEYALLTQRLLLGVGDTILDRRDESCFSVDTIGQQFGP